MQQAAGTPAKPEAEAGELLQTEVFQFVASGHELFSLSKSTFTPLIRTSFKMDSKEDGAGSAPCRLLSFTTHGRMASEEWHAKFSPPAQTEAGRERR